MTRTLGTAAAAALDVAGILVFVGIGRSVHTDGITVSGMASTAWPFLTGAGLGWIVARRLRTTHVGGRSTGRQLTEMTPVAQTPTALVPTAQAPTALVPTGVTVWLSCVVVGMVLRVVSGQGTAAAFVVVALAFLGLMMLGWRLAFHVVGRVRGAI